MALIARPTLLLLDEPTAGINPTLINGVLARLKTVNQKFGITLLVIEHNMRVIMNLAHRIYCLAHGADVSRRIARANTKRPASDRRLLRPTMNDTQTVSDYGKSDIATNISAEAVNREAEKLAAQTPDTEALLKLAGGDEYLRLWQLHAGYGKVEILHNLDLILGRGQSLCLIGPNGAGKSTVLHSIFGLAARLSGDILLGGKNIGDMSSNDKLAHAGIAYILQDNSVFPDMTVEENLMLGGYTLPMATASEATEQVLPSMLVLAKRRHQKAGALSGGERRLLEISRALVRQPSVLLVDETVHSVWSLATLTWFLKYWPIYARAKAKPLSWWNKTPKKDWPLPTSAMC